MIFLVIFFPLALFVWAAWIEPRWFHLNHHSVLISKKLVRPLRILHLSDIHFSGHHAPLFRFIDRLAREDVDFVFISGDIVDSNPGIAHCIRHLKKLKPRHGVFAVLGNHDYYDYRIRDVINGNLTLGRHLPKKRINTERLVRELESIGIQVLRNESYAISLEGTRILIHGLDDPTTGKADFGAIKNKMDRTAINILLTHSVDAFFHLDEGRIDLSFSGHSHGGQIRFPWIGPVVTHTRLGRQYADGIKLFKGAVCSISRGIYAGRAFRLRFLCPPEAIVLEVASRQSSSKVSSGV